VEDDVKRIQNCLPKIRKEEEEKSKFDVVTGERCGFRCAV
jgi:hypothetical protein